MITKERLTFSEGVSTAVNNVFKCRGRARRSEFWWTQMVVALVSCALSIIGTVLSLFTIPLCIRRLHDTGRSGWWLGASLIYQFLLYGYTIYLVLSDVAVGMDCIPERLLVEHAVGIFQLLGAFYCIGIIYEIVLIVLFCQDSQPHANKYGPSPKYMEEEAGN